MTKKIHSKEADLLIQIKWLLSMCKRRGYLDYTRIHVMPIIRGRKPYITLTENFDMEGFADIEVVFPPYGRVGYMELKSSRGTLSEAQIIFRDSRRRAGAKYEQIKTFEQGVDFLRFMGVPVDGLLKGLRPVASGSGGGSINPS